MPDPCSRLFAVIPAAGFSRRMGQPKLLLPLGESNVISRLLAALQHPKIVERCVIVRRDDRPLQASVEAANAWCVSPEVDPADMRQSVEFGLSEIRRRFSPDDQDGWLLVPADYPVLTAELIGLLIDAWLTRGSTILIPRCGERRGHPVLFRWSLACEVAQIPADRGLNWLVERYSSEVDELAVDHPSVLTDLDTVEDYERLRHENEHR